MNSFFVPQLGGQIYTMAGMVTRLQPAGRLSRNLPRDVGQFSGDGFADMYFNVEAVPPRNLRSGWTQRAAPVRSSTRKTYAELAKPSEAVAPFTYRAVAPGLFDSILVSEMQSDDAMCRSYPTSMRAEK